MKHLAAELERERERLIGREVVHSRWPVADVRLEEGAIWAYFKDASDASYGYRWYARDCKVLPQTTAQAERTDARIDDATWALIGVHTQRLWGGRRCTLCGLPIDQHDKPLPETYPTLVITCVGSPVKL